MLFSLDSFIFLAGKISGLEGEILKPERTEHSEVNSKLQNPVPRGIEQVHIFHRALEARLLFCTSFELRQAHVINEEVGAVVSVQSRVGLSPVVPRVHYGFEPRTGWT